MKFILIDSLLVSLVGWGLFLKLISRDQLMTVIHFIIGYSALKNSCYCINLEKSSLFNLHLVYVAYTLI